jgi:hypothetical protein
MHDEHVACVRGGPRGVENVLSDLSERLFWGIWGTH